MLIKLVDGGIKEIWDDTESSSGCSTCDYGSSYVNEYVFKMENGELTIEINNMYEFALSEGDMMKIMLECIDEIRTFTEEGFTVWK